MGIFRPGMFRQRRPPDQAEHIIPEEVIGRRPPVYCHACDTDAHAAEDCPTIIRPEDVWKTWGGSSIRAATLEETFEEIRRRWGRTR